MLKSVGTEFKVGLFAIAALAALGYMFFILSPEAFQDHDYAPYYTNLANAAGIIPKTQVKTAGVTIGKVKSVRLDDGKTRVEFEVDRKVKIPAGSKIEIRSVGFLGDKHLEILRPTVDGELLSPGGFIPQSSGGGDLESLIGVVSEIAKDVKKVTSSLANVLGNEQGQQSMQNIINNVESLSSDLKVTSATVRKLVGDRGEDLNDIITDIRSSMRDMRSAAKVIKSIASDENKDRINRVLAQFDQAMVDVRGSVHNINLISEKVEKGEGTIGKLVNDDSTIQEIQGAIKDIRRVIAPATKLVIDVDSHGEIRRDRSFQYWVDILFRTRPDRYYLLGFTDTKYDTLDRRETTQTGGDQTHIVQVDKIQRALRFDLQIAKRWYWVAARVGLFQTTGGVATDMYFLSDNLKLTAEAFDFNTQDSTIRRNAHFKVYASALFYNHIYGMLGLDDFTRVDSGSGKLRKLSDNLFLGAGLTFTDDDLKAIFGSAALLATPR